MENPFAAKPTEPRKIPEDAPPQAIPAEKDDEAKEVAHHQPKTESAIVSSVTEPVSADAPPTPISDKSAPALAEEASVPVDEAPVLVNEAPVEADSSSLPVGELPLANTGSKQVDEASSPASKIEMPTSVSPLETQTRTPAELDESIAKEIDQEASAPEVEPVPVDGVLPETEPPQPTGAEERPVEALEDPLTGEPLVQSSDKITTVEAPAPEMTGDDERDGTNSHHETPPPLSMEEVSCRTCQFFHFEGKSRVHISEGECRCKAPTQSEGRYATWPTVRWESWCGEWVMGVSDEEMIKMARAVADEMTGENATGFQKEVDKS